MTIVQRVSDSHRVASPGCMMLVYDVRVFDEKDLAKKPKVFPDWVHEKFKALAD